MSTPCELNELGSPEPRLEALLAHYPDGLFSLRLYHSIELLECYGLALAIRILDDLGALGQLRNGQTAEELSAVLGLTPDFTPALTWLLKRLAQAKLCTIADETNTPRFWLQRPLPALAPDRLRSLGLAIDPANAATLDLLDHAAGLYPRVARGETSGEAGLFGPAGLALWLAYFNNANPTYAINNEIAAIAATSRLAQGRRLQTRHARGRPSSQDSRLCILEVGAGAGSASESLLRQLHQKGLDGHIEAYIITEPNAFFRRRAQRALRRDDRWVFQGLDINECWTAQGISPARFDLIFGVNVLHIAQDLNFSLVQARECLAPGGWLILGECLRPQPDYPLGIELGFQLLDSYKKVRIDARWRPTPGFMTPEQWRTALIHAGLCHVEIEPELAQIHAIYPHFQIGAVCATL